MAASASPLPLSPCGAHASRLGEELSSCELHTQAQISVARRAQSVKQKLQKEATFLSARQLARSFLSRKHCNYNEEQMAKASLQSQQAEPADEAEERIVITEEDMDEFGPCESTGLLEDVEPIPIQSAEYGWCSLCGSRSGWMQCGACHGTGGYATKPGLAGVKGKVGWARCKVCYGRKVVPCLLCGITDSSQWLRWKEYAKRHPRKLVRREQEAGS